MNEQQEDAADLEALRNSLSQKQEYLPPWLVSEILNGRPPITMFMKYRGVSREELSKSSGVPVIEILKLERKDGEVSIGNLLKLASALNLDVDDIV